MNLQQMEDDFHIARERVFKKRDCNEVGHDFEVVRPHDHNHEWIKCKDCGTECLGWKFRI